MYMQHWETIWRFPEIGVPRVPPNHPFIDGFSMISHCKPSIFGYPPFWETSICSWCRWKSQDFCADFKKARPNSHQRHTLSFLILIIIIYIYIFLIYCIYSMYVTVCMYVCMYVYISQVGGRSPQSLLGSQFSIGFIWGCSGLLGVGVGFT